MLKEPFRFEHAGVLRELQALHRRLNANGQYEFGSSGDGELTIRGATRTVYARKYRRGDGWRVSIYRGGQTISSEVVNGIEAVSALVSSALK